MKRSTLASLSLVAALSLSSGVAAADTFDQMSAGYAAATGRPAGGPMPAGLRVSAELLGGAALSLAGGGVGLFTGVMGCGVDLVDSWQATSPGRSSACTGNRPTGIYGTMYLGAALGAGVAVPLMGSTRGGTGHWWGSALGTLAGSALGLAIVSQMEPDIRSNGLVFVGATAVGAVVGYELSGLVGGRSATPSTVTPVAAVVPGGGQLGLVGRF